jgi:hypothetical protein
MKDSPSEIHGLVIHENPLRCLIQSSNRKDIMHVVDLDPWEYDERTGQTVLCGERCSCENFTMRIAPLLKAGTIPFDTPLARCKHIEKARDMLANRTRDLVAERHHNAK